MRRERRLRLLRRHAITAFLEGFVVFCILVLVMITRNLDTRNTAIPYSRTSGHIIVQLAELPEPTGVGTKVDTEQEWVLYGDGTLLFRKDPGDDLWQTHLPPGTVQTILDVIINQNHFFATDQGPPRTLTQGSDENVLLLTVNANGQQQEVAVTRKSIANTSPDMQRTHLFLIEQYLLAYQPTDAVFSAPNTDLDGENGN